MRITVFVVVLVISFILISVPGPEQGTARDRLRRVPAGILLLLPVGDKVPSPGPPGPAWQLELCHPGPAAARCGPGHPSHDSHGHGTVVPQARGLAASAHTFSIHIPGKYLVYTI
jgi:hypothetical protein